ncbi:hypothetical protein FKM82_021077 [Ascaphus truei]
MAALLLAAVTWRLWARRLGIVTVVPPDQQSDHVVSAKSIQGGNKVFLGPHITPAGPFWGARCRAIWCYME